MSVTYYDLTDKPNLRRNLDIFWSSDIIVNPVNCEGISGAGLALECKTRFPLAFAKYRAMCKDEANPLRPGQACSIERDDGKSIIIAATKDKWKNPAKIEWVQGAADGVFMIASWLQLDYGMRSISVPALGAGLGGLAFDAVQPIMRETAAVIQSFTARDGSHLDIRMFSTFFDGWTA